MRHRATDYTTLKVLSTRLLDTTAMESEQLYVRRIIPCQLEPLHELVEEARSTTDTIVDEDSNAEARPDMGSTIEQLTDSLHPKAAEAYDEANQFYLAMPGHKHTHIQIHSGYRDVRAQALWYDAFMWSLNGGPPANRADKPGKSKHNYGLAIDIKRGEGPNNDEVRLKEALETNRWKSRVEDEAWHFVAEGIDGYQALITRIDSEVVPLSDRYGQYRSDYYSLKKAIEQRSHEYEAERVRLATIRPQLLSEYRTVLHEKSSVRRESARLKRERSELVRKKKEIEKIGVKLRTRYEEAPQGMRCPNGLSLGDCTHDREKARYHSWKRELQRQLDSRTTSWLNQKSSYHKSFRQNQAARKKLSRKIKTYSRKRREYDAAVRKNRKIGVNISTNRRRQREADRLSKLELTMIEVAVGNI